MRHPRSSATWSPKEIPFDNYAPRRTVAEVPTETYQRPVLYIFLVLCLYSWYSLYWDIIPSVAGVGLHPSYHFVCIKVFFHPRKEEAYLNYLTLDNNGLIARLPGNAAGPSISIPEPKKNENFDFAANRISTSSWNCWTTITASFYRKGFGKKLDKFAELQQAGVDAAYSLNDNKRFFQDTYINTKTDVSQQISCRIRHHSRFADSEWYPLLLSQFIYNLQDKPFYK